MPATKKVQELPIQKFKMERISRDQIQGAPYNPRKIGDRQKKALKASLEKVGLITPLVWNARTGNLVGGHQRLNALDSLMRTKNYSMDVAVVDMDEREEAQANVLLNSHDAMGEFDFTAVKDLADMFKLDLGDDLCFDRDTLLISFGQDIGDAAVQKRDAYADADLMQEIKDRKKAVREKYSDAIKERQGDGPQGVLRVVFDSQKEMEAFLAREGLDPSSSLVSASDLFEDPPEEEVEDPDLPG